MERKILISLFLLLSMIDLTWGATISGRVTDYYGKIGLSNIVVKAYDYYGVNTTIYETLTDSNGNYSLEVPSGVYILGVNTNQLKDSSYVSQFYPGYFNSLYATAIDVSSDNAENINFYLTMGFKLRISFKDQLPENLNPVIYNRQTQYSFGGLISPYVNYESKEIIVNLPQGIYDMIYYDNQGFYLGDKTSIIVNDDVNLDLEPVPNTGSINGYVFDAEDNPVKYATVTAIDKTNGYYFAYVYTDENGYYEIKNLPANRSYYLLACTSVYSDKMLPSSFYPNSITPEGAQIIQVNPGSVNPNKNFYLSAQGATVEGYVYDNSGNPIQNAAVFDFYISDSLNPYKPYYQRLVYTDEQGHFVLENIAPATIGVVAVATNYLPEMWKEKNDTSNLNNATKIELHPGDLIDNIEFTLTPYSELSSAPYIYYTIPHYLTVGKLKVIDVYGANFSENFTVDIYSDANLKATRDSIQVNLAEFIDSSHIKLTLSAPSSLKANTYTLLIVNPDGQIATYPLHLIYRTITPETAVLVSPHKATLDTDVSIWINLVNMTENQKSADLYFGLILPDDTVYFFDGSGFTREIVPVLSNFTIEKDFYLPLTMLFFFNISTTLPSGNYQVFSALLNPGQMSVINYSIKNFYIYF